MLRRRTTLLVDQHDIGGHSGAPYYRLTRHLLRIYSNEIATGPVHQALLSDSSADHLGDLSN